MPDRLVVLGSATGGLAVARAGHRLGRDVHVVDRTPGIAFSSRRARASLTPDAGDAALEHILSLAGDGGAALVAVSDVWLQFIRSHRRELAKVFLIPHPRDEVIDICLSKSAFARWCEANHIASPRETKSPLRTPRLVLAHSESNVNADDANADDLPTFPVIVRPDRTCHDTPHFVPKAIEVRSSDSLDTVLGRFHRARAKPAITESLLGRPLRQYSVPFARNAGTTLAFVAEKLRPLSNLCSVGSYVEARPYPAIESVARRVIEQLDCDGIGEVEILHDLASGKNYVIEVNPRPWTQFSLARALGFDFLAHVLGPGLPSKTQPPRPVRWIDFRNDLYTVFSRREGMLPAGRIGWGGYLASIIQVGACAKFDLLDPWPMISDIASLISNRGRLANALDTPATGNDTSATLPD